uniref:Uncharacterized protein n=1 Tax=Anguilla anguilla TaxID=7936 RepID=A0A0E9VBD6_ANGAN
MSLSQAAEAVEGLAALAGSLYAFAQLEFGLRQALVSQRRSGDNEHGDQSSVR